MKSIVLIIILLVAVMACSNERLPLVEMSILMDTTDDIDHITYEDVRSFFDYSNTELIWYESTIRKRELTDVRYGTVSTSHLPKGELNRVTEQQRKVAVRQFLKQTESLMLSGATKGKREQSHLYFAIAEELNTLSRSSALNRIAIISSNLLENTLEFSVYRETDRKLLRDNPDSVAHILSKELPLQNLSGITVYIVYRATSEDHTLFTGMSSLYQKMLTEKGATVHIAANLNPQILGVP